MNFNDLPAGNNLPHNFNVFIEIPMYADPVKYEVDKKSGIIFVNRFMNTTMRYPCNYGYIPQTLCKDGDPVDVLVITPFPLFLGIMICCRPIGILKMTDESGIDAKILAVPIDKITSMYTHWKTPNNLNEIHLKQIQHFFEHYKDLEKEKWTKIDGWEGPESAKIEILNSVTTYNKSKNN